MNSITLKNIPVQLHVALKGMAKNNHRSLNGEILSCLEKYALGNRQQVFSTLELARQARVKFKRALSDLEIQEAIQEGRE